MIFLFPDLLLLRPAMGMLPLPVKEWNLPTLPVTDEVKALAGIYLTKLLIPQKAYLDAMHLALASVYHIDYLLTWNCKHIASGSVKKALPQINAGFGFSCPTICTPEELLYESEGLD